MNEGNAVLIIGTIYLHLVHGLDIVVTFLLLLLGIGTWSYHAWVKSREKLLKAQVRLAEAKANYYERKGAKATDEV